MIPGNDAWEFRFKKTDPKTGHVVVDVELVEGIGSDRAYARWRYRNDGRNDRMVIRDLGFQMLGVRLRPELRDYVD